MSKLKYVRESKGISQETIADAVGVSRNSYMEWEKNPGMVRVENALKICEFLGVSIDDIFLPKDVS